MLVVLIDASVGVFFTDLIFTKGKDPEKSAKKAVGATLALYIGNALLQDLVVL